MEVDTHKFYNYDGFSTSTSVGLFGLNYIYATTHHLISSSLYISAIIPATCTTTYLVRYFINGLSGCNRPVDVKKLRKFYLSNPENIVIKTLESTTQLGSFNQRLPARQYNKRLHYIGPHQHEDDTIATLFSSVKTNDGTTAVKLIVGTKTLLTDVYAIGSKSVLNIAKVLQYRFCKRGIPINIWSNNSQEEFMGSVHKLLRAYGVGSKKSEAHK